MAKFKNIQKGFLMRNAIRFWGNVVRNYDKEINDEEFFNLVHYCMGPASFFRRYGMRRVSASAPASFC